MKKKLFSVLLVLVLVLSLTLVTAIPVSAAGGNAKGAVKADLTEYFKSPEPGDVVGSVILNTTANGRLIVVVKINAVPGLDGYDVKVHINRDSDSYVFTVFQDVLNTDDEGYGEVNVKVDISDFTDSPIDVDVVLRQSFNPTKTTPCYTTRWPVQVPVPLK